MSWVEVHRGLANASTLFVAALAIWALFLRLRSQPLDGGWFGAAVIGELLLLAQFGVGWILWFQGMGAVLPRAWIHILYGVVAIITLPAAYLYFSKIQDPKVQTIAMAVACAFLWGIVLRASQVVFIPIS
ncbi:MAG: hypothetical protein M9936_00705 [Caldilinea sp.]|nr:hypothetical protein [Caldilinea sp.]MCB9117289.1 hypothetical protein [Caldilineaceae bacterium]MCB0038657.1 hypothetical protein [Caldilinea sp.]MCB0053687.1 hypothetical protein [Caldilinea sp.]MCB9118682.1 hypothetical protein [Caldilineaceae bacterium]